MKAYRLVVLSLLVFAMPFLLKASYPYNLIDYLKFEVTNVDKHEAALTGYYEALGVDLENYNWGYQIPPNEPIIIPSVVTIDGEEYTVTEIADKALKGLGHFSNPQRYEDFWPKIVLPETIRRLGKQSLWTFYLHPYTQVNLPHSLEEMADSCLLACSGGGHYNIFENVRSIGKNVFQGFGLDIITFMNNNFELNPDMFDLEMLGVLCLWGENMSIASNTFGGPTEINRLVLGAYPCSIASNAFGENTSIDKIVVYCPEPYALPEDAFSSGIYQNTQLLVPQNALQSYMNAPGWKNFVNIGSINNHDVNYDGSITASDVTALYNFLLDGDVESLMSSDVDGDGAVTSGDVTVLYNNLLNGDTPTIEQEVTYTVNGVSFNMVTVEGGTFNMGEISVPEGPYYYYQNPDDEPWSVKLSTYSIGQTEVTQELWLAVMGSNPSGFNGDEYGTDLQRPVENVSWNDCQEFISQLNSLTGQNFRLPTEAQWEFAARGGNYDHGYIYSGGNNLDDVAWYRNNSGGITHAVGQLAANELGLYDMTGNVYEWCSDWKGPYHHNLPSPFYNPEGPWTGSERVQRGGDILSYPNVDSSTYQLFDYLLVVTRNAHYPNNCSKYRGLRLAL
ncbi:MAG: SUMF1/EgtB/PvdO family nonheme iron enzyme [Muribaculaceae bacterium]|nr:SUMF1/EgtB/PvdO family nonheme iron enzyme [Muribaculaceae bacterium]